MTQGTDKEVAMECVIAYIDMQNWLQNCPAQNVQPFIETAQRNLNGYYETGRKSLVTLGLPALAEKFRKIHEDGLEDQEEYEALSDLLRDISDLLRDIDEQIE